MKKQYSPYEQNQLQTYGISLEKALRYGDMPVEYITGHCEFYGHDFLVDKHVLIPRVEEEDLIKLGLERVASFPSSFFPHPSSFVLSDLGTGSGVLGITLYEELTALGLQSATYLSDISSRALAVAQKNGERLVGKMYYNHSGPAEQDPAMQDRTGLILLQSDLFWGYPKGLRFDLVVANLPYIPSSRIASLPPSVKDFEPRLALDGGRDGLTVIKKLLAQLPARLKPHGAAILEIDETHKISDLPKIKGLRYEIKKDQFGKNRFLVVGRHAA